MNIYDIFGTCYKEPTEKLRSLTDGEVQKPFWTAADYTPWIKKKKSDNLKELPPCTFGAPIIMYLNNASTMEALNIPKDIPRAPNTTYQWDLCRGPEDEFYYTPGSQASQWIYEALKGKYRFLKYSGDIDAAVPTTGTRKWIDSMNLDILEDWRPYLVENES
jgi:hypothetical protein